jgi:hypothetical protein
MHGFVAIYGSRQIDVYADSLYQAKQKAIAQLKVRKSQEHMVSVMLAEKDIDPATMKGAQVYHSTAGL